MRTAGLLFVLSTNRGRVLGDRSADSRSTFLLSTIRGRVLGERSADSRSHFCLVDDCRSRFGIMFCGQQAYSCLVDDWRACFGRTLCGQQVYFCLVDDSRAFRENALRTAGHTFVLSMIRGRVLGERSADIRPTHCLVDDSRALRKLGLTCLANDCRSCFGRMLCRHQAFSCLVEKFKTQYRSRASCRFVDMRLVRALSTELARFHSPFSFLVPFNRPIRSPDDCRRVSCCEQDKLCFPADVQRSICRYRWPGGFGLTLTAHALHASFKTALSHADLRLARMPK